MSGNASIEDLGGTESGGLLVLIGGLFLSIVFKVNLDLPTKLLRTIAM